MSDNLVFGNPYKEMLTYIEKQTYLDTLLPELKNHYPPQNASGEAQQELFDLVSMMQEFNASSEQTKGRYFSYDKELEKFIVLTLEKSGIPKKDTYNVIKQIHDDIIPLIVKLKYHYQRIRPYQLAYYYNVALYPYFSETAATPSYPSGHALQSKLYCEVLGNIYPEFYNALQDLAEDIAKSRMQLGLHFKSDCEFAKLCADTILKNSEFKKKYQL